jgi:imidazolonepropionase-like amidohydrolase
LELKNQNVKVVAVFFSGRYDPTREGYYWNDHIRPEQNAAEHFKFDNKAADELRKAGFGVVNTHLQDGIMRGTGALIALTTEGGDSEILSSRSAAYLSLSKSVTSTQSYPSSIMGTLALIRQVHYDADWYAKGGTLNKDLSLQAFNANKDLVKIMVAGNLLNDLRVDKVGDQFGTQYVIVGGGDEYERIKEIKATNATYILPLDFPKPYDVEDPFTASVLELSAMREWNQRPSNPKVLAENGVPFTFTAEGLRSPSMLLPNVIKAIDYGLDKTKALEALTTVPAQILGQSNKVGSLKNGAYANFLITSGDIFDKGTTLYENWVRGDQSIINNMNVKDINGDYSFTIAGNTYDVSISGSTGKKPKADITSAGKQLGSKITYKDNWLNLTFTSTDEKQHEFMRFTARVDHGDNLNGKLIDQNGNTAYVLVRKTSNKEDAGKSGMNRKGGNKANKVLPVTYPNGAYGSTELPKQETILFKNATVWTSEAEGILKNTDVLIKNGKIAKIGKNLSDSSAKVVDATGKHLTAGIIDEHSHIAASSINEGGQNSSAEVTMEDAIDPTDIAIYRDLAGGVTSIQLLHGSANPIGGRSAILKLKWGETADNLINKNGSKFIKFALGENVKQSRSPSGTRFPRTRMGVEQLYVDYFTRAKEYDAKKKSGKPYRKDLELETLDEILNGERFITCHSYVQSEINMLMKVADRFHFKVNTFTHILEGYKVADKMKAHGVGASTFSDWWAYKFEVNDAIPYNASILNNVGVTVAINSDDAEMSRRLNQEAGKTLKYGNVSEEDAWKMVTINPAKLLHLDKWVGSIKVGKDADVVLWNDNPLSVYAKAEKTMIEGATYFDIEKDKQMRTKIKQERNELMAMMLQEKNKGMKTQPIKAKDKQEFRCETMD